jgi:zinc protease
MLRKYSPLLISILLLIMLPAAAAAVPPVERTVLPNGLTLIVCEDHSLPSVTMQFLVEAGSRRDPHDRGGLAYLTARAVLMGTPGRDVTAIQEELDFLGASLSSSAAEDYATFGLKVLKKDLARGFELMFSQLTRPSLPRSEIERERQRIMAAIQSDEEEPLAVAEREFQKAIYLDFAYGHPSEGTEESVKKIKKGDVQDFYKSFYHPNNALLVIVGDITAEEVRTAITPSLLKWKSQEVPKEDFRTGFAGRRTLHIERNTAQASIILGSGGVSRDNADYYTLTLMNYIMGGGGFGSRMFDEIRVKRGLVYSVDSVFVPAKKAGSFQVVLQTKNESALEAVDLVLKEIDRIREAPVSDAELQRAKSYLVGSFPMRLDTQSKLSRFLTQVEYFGLGLDYPDRYPSIINAITKEDIQRAARKYLDPKNYVLVIVGNVKKEGAKQE